MWHEHWKGWGNGIVDCLSRDDLEMAFRLAHAFGIKLASSTSRKDEAVQRFLRRTLVRTRPAPARCVPNLHQGRRTAIVTIDVGASPRLLDVLDTYQTSALRSNVECYLVLSGKLLDEAATMAAARHHQGRHAARCRCASERACETSPIPPSPLHPAADASPAPPVQADPRAATAEPTAV